MNITGIIAEYNPFHQGHAFHLARAREMTHADFLIVVMSGNYVQRGVPAMFDKYTRARAALRGGADLVLELPVCAACGSAEYFARGAVSLLHHTGIVTDLCFGSECGDLKLLSRAAEILAEEPEAFKSSLHQAMKTGSTFAAARAQALRSCAPELPPELWTHPNNLLGTEYLKTILRLQSSIRPHTLTRRGNAYHDQEIAPGSLASASAIRRMLIQQQGLFSEVLKEQLPFSELYEEYEGLPPLTEDAFSLPLLVKLRMLEGEDLSDYFDIPRGLSDRIWNHLDLYTSYSQFTELLKTRNLTRTSVSRSLLHILLELKEYRPPSCFRVLGFRKSSSSLLKGLHTHGTLPVLTRPGAAVLPREELFPDHLYESVRSLFHHTAFQNEYRRKLIVL